MSPMIGPGGRDISGDLDNYITGHYGEDDPANQPEPRTFTEATDEAGEVVYMCLGCNGFAKDPSDICHEPDCTVQEDGTEFLIEEDCS